jgi:hypothetical protein
VEWLLAAMRWKQPPTILADLAATPLTIPYPWFFTFAALIKAADRTVRI